MVFYLLESGHSREAVLDYEVQYILGFMQKRSEVYRVQEQKMAARRSANPPAQSGRGTRKVVTTMTQEQMAAKARAQREK